MGNSHSHARTKTNTTTTSRHRSLSLLQTVPDELYTARNYQAGTTQDHLESKDGFSMDEDTGSLVYQQPETWRPVQQEEPRPEQQGDLQQPEHPQPEGSETHNMEPVARVVEIAEVLEATPRTQLEQLSQDAQSGLPSKRVFPHGTEYAVEDLSQSSVQTSSQPPLSQEDAERSGSPLLSSKRRRISVSDSIR